MFVHAVRWRRYWYILMEPICNFDLHKCFENPCAKNWVCYLAKFTLPKQTKAMRFLYKRVKGLSIKFQKIDMGTPTNVGFRRQYRTDSLLGRYCFLIILHLPGANWKDRPQSSSQVKKVTRTETFTFLSVFRIFSHQIKENL